MGKMPPESVLFPPRLSRGIARRSPFPSSRPSCFVEFFLDGDVGHRRRWRRRRASASHQAGIRDHVAGPDFLDRAAPALRAAAAGGNDQGLAERMGMPRGASARLEGDAGAEDARAGRLAEQTDRCAPCR